jgi:molybdopterin molybdotransferase
MAAPTITVEEHLARVLDGARALPSEPVPVECAYDRVLAADVVCVSPSPRFDNSAMDGYAVRQGDLSHAAAARPAVLAVTGEARAGSADAHVLRRGTAIRIMTGAPIPAGADAVVPVERTVESDWAATSVTFAAAPEQGANIRLTGEDLTRGETVLKAGTVMGPYEVAAAVAAGVARVRVRARPRVVVISTGDELRPPGATLPLGAIHDANGPLMHGLAAAAGALVVRACRAGDGEGMLHTALEEAVAGRPDVVILTGGVGAGSHDPVRHLDLGFASVAMRPGMPQAFGRVCGAAVFGLPGNPVAAAVSFDVFVLPFLKVLQGLRPEPETENAIAEAGWASPHGRRQFTPVVTRRVEGTLHVRPATDDGSGSHLIGRLARANGYAVVPEDVVKVSPGDRVTVRLRP